MKSAERRCGRLDRLAAGVALTTAALAVWQELNTPKEVRTWHGLLFGWLPYDFRRPTAQRIRETFWAPADRRVFKPRAFGIGWDINLGRVCRLLSGRSDGGGRR